METISIKLEENLLKELDGLLVKNRYSTRTEFIREAIRDKVKVLERNKAILEMYGKSKRKTTDEELHKAGEAAVKELEEKFK